MAVQGSKITVEVFNGKSPLAGVAVAISPDVYATPDLTGTPVASITSDGRGIVTCWATPGTYTFTPAEGGPILDQTVENTESTGPVTVVAASVTVGAVTTGAPGSDANVSNAGTAQAAVLDFTIPQGDKGDKGDKGDTGDVSSVDGVTPTSGNVALGALKAANNLSDVGDPATALSNIGAASASALTEETTRAEAAEALLATPADIAAVTPIVVPASLAGLTDITAAVQALIDSAPTGGHLHFQGAASTYNFAGTVTTAAGSRWAITGDGDTSELKSTAGLPIFEIGHGATGNTDGFTIRGVKLTCLVDADYASGLLVLRWIRCFDIDISLKMSGTGTGVLLDTSYVGRLRGNWRLSRYAVGVEHDGRLSPSTQQDTVSYEMTCFTPHGIIIRTATTNFHGLKFSGKHVSPVPDQWTYGETALSVASAAGDTTVNVTDATNFAIGDPIFLDYGVNIEVNRVASTGTGTITVARPLRFAHASGQPVIKGGFSISLSSWVRGAAVTTTHFEGTEIAVLADTPYNLTLGDAVYSSAAELTRFYGACTAVVIGQVEQGNSTAVRNYIVNDDAVTSVTACWIDGPCTATSGSAVPVTLTKSAKFPTVPTRKASVPLMSRLTANTAAVNNSTTLVDSGLSVAVEANAVYKVRALVGYSASTAADLAAKFSGPTGATFTCTPNALRAAATGASDTIQRQVRAISDTQVWGGIGVGSQVFAIVEGLLHISTTAGTFKLQFAQSAADATDALIYADSYIELLQVA